MVENLLELYPYYRKITPSNMVLMFNHADLYDTGFVPQLVIPDNEYFDKNGQKIPIQLAKGLSWYDLINSYMSENISVKTHLKIGLIAATQMRKIWKERGLLIFDRCEVNIFVAGDVEDSEGELNVTHIDLQEVYDGNLGGERIGIDENGDVIVNVNQGYDPEGSVAYEIADPIRTLLRERAIDTVNSRNFLATWKFANLSYPGQLNLDGLVRDLNGLIVDSEDSGIPY